MTMKSDRIDLGNGVYLNLIENDLFKSNVLSYYFIRPLTGKEVTKNALIPLVLKRGTKDYPSSLEIDRRLEELYGANLSIGVNKRGEKQVIRYSMEWASEKYLGKSGLDIKAAQILKDIIYSPVLEDDVFKYKYVEQEKENLKNIIKSRINNKRSYAIDRCIEAMCKNERYSIYPLGKVDDLEDIYRDNLYSHYKDVLNTSPVEIFYIGQYDDELVDFLKEINNVDRKEIVDIPEDVIIESVQTKNLVRDRLDVNQGKIVVGCRSGIRYDDKLYNALLIANDIYGGGANSKLFNKIREEESLAYYIGSSVYKYKSIITIDGGIEFDDFDIVSKYIREELNSMKLGDFTDEDIQISKKSLISRTKSIKDNPFGIGEFFFSQVLSNDFRDLDTRIDDYSKVTRDDIIAAAKTIDIDTIYLMRDKAEK